MPGRIGLLACASFALASCDGGSGRAIKATGSSTVHPFTKAVADAFVEARSGRAAPEIESTGTGAGFIRFCEGVGYEYPDIANASRRMKRAEYNKCQAKGVGEILEVPIGLDGIAFAESNAGPKLQLTRKDIYLALAANPRGKPNATKTWKDVNPALPAIPILVMGPPATSGTREAFVELILQPGCLEAMPEAQALKEATDPAPYHNACGTLRADGAYVQKGEDDHVIVQGLSQDPNAIGLIGYSYLEENKGKLHGVPIDGVAPDAASIASGKYAGMRLLYLYVKKKHIQAAPELQEFLNLYATMWAPGGPLARHGLVPASQRVRERSAETINIGRSVEAGSLP